MSGLSLSSLVKLTEFEESVIIQENNGLPRQPSLILSV